MPSTWPETSCSIIPGRERRMASLCISAVTASAVSISAISSGALISRCATMARMRATDAFFAIAAAGMSSNSDN